MTKKFIDTNILARLVVGDGEKQVEMVKNLFKKASQNNQHLYIIPEVLMELSYVLSSSYKLDKETVAEVLEKIATMNVIKLAETKNLNLKNVTSFFQQENISLEDCLYLQLCLQNEMELVTFDKKLNNIFQKEKEALA